VLIFVLPHSRSIIYLVNPVVDVSIILLILIHRFINCRQVNVIVVSGWLVVQGRLVVKGRRQVVWHEIVHLLKLVILLLVVGIFTYSWGSILALDGRVFVRHRGASLVFVMLVISCGGLVGS
jgi:hypothetical protein